MPSFRDLITGAGKWIYRGLTEIPKKIRSVAETVTSIPIIGPAIQTAYETFVPGVVRKGAEAILGAAEGAGKVLSNFFPQDKPITKPNYPPPPPPSKLVKPNIPLPPIPISKPTHPPPLPPASRLTVPGVPMLVHERPFQTQMKAIKTLAPLIKR